MKKNRTSLPLLFAAGLFVSANAQNTPHHFHWSSLRLPDVASLKNLPAPTTAAAPVTVAQNRDGEDEFVVSATQGRAEFEPCAAMHPTDTNSVIVAFTSSIVAFSGDLATVEVRFSTDFGKTWAAPSVFNFKPEDKQVIGGGVPSLAFDANGRAHLAWVVVYADIFNPTPIQYRLHYAFSDDKGATWTNATQALATGGLDWGMTIGQSVDKPTLAFEPKTKNLVVTYTRSFNTVPTEPPTDEILVRRLAPGASQWSQPVRVSSTGKYSVARFSHLDADGLGNLHLVFSGTRNDGSQSIFYSTSTDGGASFSAETSIADFHFPGIGTGEPHSCGIDCGTDFFAYNWPRIAADRSSGDLLLTFNACDTTAATGGSAMPQRVFYQFKKAGQPDWSAASLLSPTLSGSKDHFFASIANNGAGVWLANFYDQSEDTSGGDTRHVSTFSTDGCQNFAVPMPCSTAPTDLCTADQISGFLSGGIGPGVGATAQIVATRHAALAFWSDGRTNDGDLDIFGCRLALPQLSSTDDAPARPTQGIGLRCANPSPRGWVRVGLFLEKEVAAADFEVSVFSATGKMLARRQVSLRGAEELPLDFYLPEAGAYFFKIGTGTGVSTRRLLVF